jgi:hypothetical protein
MCWLGNNRLVIASRDLGVTTFAIRDHYGTSEWINHPSSGESKATMMGNDSNGVSLLESSSQQSSSMIQTESFRAHTHDICTLCPLLVPPSMIPLILAASPSPLPTATTTTVTKVAASNETNRSNLPHIGDTPCELISTCIMIGDDSVILLRVYFFRYARLRSVIDYSLMMMLFLLLHLFYLKIEKISCV